VAQQDLAAQQDLVAQHVLVAHPQPNWHLTLSQPRSVLQPEIKCAMIHHGILFSIRFYIKLFCLHSTQQRHGLLAQHEPHLPSVRLQLLPQFRARSRKKNESVRYMSALHLELLSFTLFWTAASFGREARTAMTIGRHRIVAGVAC